MKKKNKKLLLYAVSGWLAYELLIKPTTAPDDPTADITKPNTDITAIDPATLPTAPDGDISIGHRYRPRYYGRHTSA